MGEVDILKQQVEELSKRIILLENLLQKNQKETIKEALIEFTSQNKKESLKTEFLRKFNKNKKNLIKQKIIETIKAKPTSLPDLKYLIVDQLVYCSKASFYRYIKEMKDIIEVKENIVYMLQQVIV